MKRYILTGAPGSGKTAILHDLKGKGYSVVEEAATDVIAQEQAAGNPEPWKNADFADKITDLQKQRQIHSSALNYDLQFYDRSPICTYALCRYLGFLPSIDLLGELDRMEREKIYQKQVFFIENLGFCTPSVARQISFKDSLVFEKIHWETYQSAGYECIKIGSNSVAERADRILGVLNPPK